MVLIWIYVLWSTLLSLNISLDFVSPNVKLHNCIATKMYQTQYFFCVTHANLWFPHIDTFWGLKDLCANPRTNPWNFGGNCSAFGDVEKLGHFDFFLNIYFFFVSSPWKLVTNYVLEWMGLNFYYNDGLQPKMRAGIINEHECILDSTEN